MNHTGMAEHHVLGKNFYMDMSIPIAGCAHQAGTCRFGTDPATSVLDVNCKAHELDNLYVVDTSFFPSIGAVNPALTAMANALRVGEHIAQRSINAPPGVTTAGPPCGSLGLQAGDGSPAPWTVPAFPSALLARDRFGGGEAVVQLSRHQRPWSHR